MLLSAHQHFVTDNLPYYQQGLSIANPWACYKLQEALTLPGGTVGYPARPGLT
jgi:hypothetical protein